MIFRFDGEILPSRAKFAVRIRSDRDTDRRETSTREKRGEEKESGVRGMRDTRIDLIVGRSTRKAILPSYLAIYRPIRR